MNKIAAFSDGENKQFTLAFEELEKFSNKYIKEMLGIGGYPAVYPWPVDNLHNWSRWWEYSFAWLELKSAARKGMRVLDIGPALTFWPFFLAGRGFETVALDKDRRIKKWAEAARKSPQLKFVTGDIAKTGFPDNSFDAVTNISVIEHTKDKRKVLREIFRLLKPGGKLINTLDISLDGKPIGDSRPLMPGESYEFIRIVNVIFGNKTQFDFTHPMDMVTPGKYPKKFTNGSLHASRFHLIRQLWKMLTPRFSLNFLLNPDRLDMWTVMGIAVQKSSIKR